MNFPWSSKKPDDVLYSIISCKKCDANTMRPYKNGDTVFVESACPKCNGTGRVESIYAAPPMR